jgi:hypothetical protein
MSLDLFLKFSVKEESHTGDEVFEKLLIEGEKIELSFSHTRDKLVFTNKRIIAYDVQGMTGAKKSFRVFPYSKITSFMIETAGMFDGDNDFKIWLSGVGGFEVKFSTKIDIHKIGAFVSKYV